jgi:hypothetical protein
VRTGPDEKRVAGSDLDPLSVEHVAQLVGADPLAGRQDLDPAVVGDVGEDAPSDEAAGDREDVVARGALRRHRGGADPAVHLAAVEAVREGIPVGGGVDRHRQHVVGEGRPVPIGGRVARQLGHHVQGIHPARPGRLRQFRLQLEAE